MVEGNTSGLVGAWHIVKGRVYQGDIRSVVKRKDTGGNNASSAKAVLHAVELLYRYE